MATPARYVSYTRVSTQRQNMSGLGREAQEKAVLDHIEATGGKLIEEYEETESGGRADRPELAKALRACRVHNATLLIAKLDRLARDAHFLLGLEKAGIEFIACDMPSANRLTVGIMALVAEEERHMISARTKAALAAAKARGVKLGGDRGNLPQVARLGALASIQARQGKAKKRATDLMPIIEDVIATGKVSLRAIANELNNREITTPRGGIWSAVQVKRVMDCALS